MSWMETLKNNITDLSQIKDNIKIDAVEEKKLNKLLQKHPMSVTKYYMSLIDWDDENDPIRKMIIPSIGELNTTGSYDTSGEQENTKLVGLQHKYAETALILATNRCAAYCRHCFRKRLVGLTDAEIISKFNDAAEYVKSHPEIKNVLISGGDPFVLPTYLIEKMLEELSDIPHLKFIRFGTRTPVTFPDRILEDDSLIDLLKRYSSKERRLYVVTHFNHPKEITEQSTAAIDKLLNAGIITQNQAVLLKGVNDDPATLIDLMVNMRRIGVVTYYLFQCRPVKRVKHHFAVPFIRAYPIIADANKRLDGPSKMFKYIMSHRTGKIEIVGIIDNELYMRYHEAKKPEIIGKLFKRKLNDTAAWLDDLD